MPTAPSRPNMLQALVPSRNRSRVFRQTVRHTALPAFRLLSDNAVIPKTTALAVPDATSRQNMPVCIPKLTLKVPGNIPAKIVRNPMNSAMAKPLNLPEARLKPVIRFAVVPQLITKPTRPAKISILLRLQAPPGTLSVLNVPNRYPEAIRHLRRHPADQFWGWTKVMSA